MARLTGAPPRARPRRRRFGQHFLVDRRVASRIVSAAALGMRPPVLEIGPGRGALTGLLRRATDRLYLIEIDRDLVRELRARYADDPDVVIVEGDVLDVDLASLLEEPGVHVVANLPYNVASQILLQLVEIRARCPLAVVTLQEEMARRVAAAPGGPDYGVLTLLVQLYAEVERCFAVPRASFAPPPQVESATVRLRLHERPRVRVDDPMLFRYVVRGVFQHRRKMIRGTLGTVLEELGADRCGCEAVLREAGIDETKRPQDVDLESFGRLTAAVAARCGPDPGRCDPHA
jgi:16S rRNA (adenine1518-N6/adenine1519-N6)-dimethyltransferase